MTLKELLAGKATWKEVFESPIIRVGAVATAIVAIFAAGNLLNNWLLLRPIGAEVGKSVAAAVDRAMKEERKARQEADAEIIAELHALRYYDVPNLASDLGEKVDGVSEDVSAAARAQRRIAAADRNYSLLLETRSKLDSVLAGRRRR